MTKLHLKMAEMMNMSYLPIGDSSHDLFISQVTDNLLKGSRFHHPQNKVTKNCQDKIVHKWCVVIAEAFIEWERFHIW